MNCEILQKSLNKNKEREIIKFSRFLLLELQYFLIIAQRGNLSQKYTEYEQNMIEGKNGKNRFFLKRAIKIFDFRLFSF